MTETRTTYGRFCEHLILAGGDRLTRQSVMKRLAFFREAQWWPSDRLRSYQLSALRATVRTAADEVPFYRDLYEQHGVGNLNFATLDDVRHLPLVSKEMLRAAYPARCTRSTGKPTQEMFTSGSTGRPFAAMLDVDDLSVARALMFLRAEYSGWRIGDPFLQTGISPKRGLVRAVKDRLLKCSYVSAFDLSDDVLDRYLSMMRSKRLRYIMGYAASLYLLAQRARKTGVEWPLFGAVSWGDNLFPHYRQLIESVFSCRVTDTYGCGEGLQLAAQCGAADNSYHVFMPHVLVEVLKDGLPAEPGELGEIVVTRLHPGAMPLIRYRVGDLGRRASAAPCACGRGLERLQAIDGRATDIVVTPNGSRLIVHFFTGILEFARSIDTFQVIQDEPSSITVRVVPRGAFDSSEWSELKSEMLAKGDPNLRIELEIVDSIPLERNNKRRFVISHLAKHEGHDRSTP